MERPMWKLILMLIVTVLMTGNFARPGFAFPQFQKEFVKLYVSDSEAAKKLTGEDEEPSFAELATGKKTKCFSCHQGKKSKKNRNSYGAALGKLIGKKDKKDTKKIVEALEKVAKMHTDAKDDKSPTYADLIKAGKLPGGPLEEMMKEPKPGPDKKDSSDKT